ncbi:hypothetical protein ABIA35_003764 [Catenulispora sp. MAP12-49]|uniref:hypothetical protein n=1 Tax=Catenulispora sp. MAP12-49 TaxID=3156302 RepID=UPI003518CC8F
MSTTRGIRILVGTALASSVILLGGCSSSGTTPAAATGGANPLTGGLTSHSSSSSDDSSTGGSSSSSSDGSSTGGSSSSSSDDSSTGGSTGGLGGSDPGCSAAMTDLTNGSTTISNAAGNLGGAIAAIKGIGDKLHADAGKSSNPAAAAAINKLGDDWVGMASQASSGKTPDMNAITSDSTAMITACSG